MTKEQLLNIKEGDRVIRILGGSVTFNLIVARVENNLIYAYDPKGIVLCGYDEYRFLVSNGAEYDPELGWDGITKTGSMLVTDVAHAIHEYKALGIGLNTTQVLLAKQGLINIRESKN